MTAIMAADHIRKGILQLLSRNGRFHSSIRRAGVQKIRWARAIEPDKNGHSSAFKICSIARNGIRKPPTAQRAMGCFQTNNRPDAKVIIITPSQTLSQSGIAFIPASSNTCRAVCPDSKFTVTSARALGETEKAINKKDKKNELRNIIGLTVE